MPYPRDRQLDHLDQRFRPLAVELIARSVEAGIALLIVETRRSEAQHQEDLVNGRSWIARSLHQDGLAIDVAPFEIFNLHGPDKVNWDANDPVWERLAVIGEALGLRAGYRWKQRDAGHFEFRPPEQSSPHGGFVA